MNYTSFPSLSMVLLSVGEMPKGSILHFDKSFLFEVLFYWINIVVFIGILVFLLYKPVKRFMNQRAQRIENQLEQSGLELQNAQKLKEEYAAHLRHIDQDREQVLQLAHKKALERGDQIIAEARKEAESIYHRGIEELRQEQENALDDMKRQIVEISTLMAGRFVELSMDRATQDRYIDQAIENLGDGLWQN